MRPRCPPPRCSGCPHSLRAAQGRGAARRRAAGDAGAPPRARSGDEEVQRLAEQELARHVLHPVEYFGEDDGFLDGDGEGEGDEEGGAAAEAAAAAAGGLDFLDMGGQD